MHKLYTCLQQHSKLLCYTLQNRCYILSELMVLEQKEEIKQTES